MILEIFGWLCFGIIVLAIAFQLDFGVDYIKTYDSSLRIGEFMDNEISQCPFCKGNCKVQYKGSGKKRTYYVICFECKAKSAETQTESEAVALWNRRVSQHI